MIRDNYPFQTLSKSMCSKDNKKKLVKKMWILVSLDNLNALSTNSS